MTTGLNQTWYAFVNYADPALGIQWENLEAAEVSEADKNHPLLKDVKPLRKKICKRILFWCISLYWNIWLSSALIRVKRVEEMIAAGVSHVTNCLVCYMTEDFEDAEGSKISNRGLLAST